MSELSVREIQEILRIFAESELQELRLDLGDIRLAVSKGGAPIGDFSAPSLVAATGPSSPPATPSASEAASSTMPQRAQEPQPEPATQDADSAEGAATPSREGLYELKSPLLGVFYRRPAPDKPPFVEVGSQVDADDPVCTVDVMKMFTQIPAGQRGRIVEICVEDGALVQHGQTLVLIDPA